MSSLVVSKGNPVNNQSLTPINKGSIASLIDSTYKQVNNATKSGHEVESTVGMCLCTCNLNSEGFNTKESYLIIDSTNKKITIVTVKNTKKIKDKNQREFTDDTRFSFLVGTQEKLGSKYDSTNPVETFKFNDTVTRNQLDQSLIEKHKQSSSESTGWVKSTNRQDLKGKTLWLRIVHNPNENQDNITYVTSKEKGVFIKVKFKEGNIGGTIGSGSTHLHAKGEVDEIQAYRVENGGWVKYNVDFNNNFRAGRENMPYLCGHVVLPNDLSPLDNLDKSGNLQSDKVEKLKNDIITHDLDLEEISLAFGVEDKQITSGDDEKLPPQ